MNKLIISDAVFEKNSFHRLIHLESIVAVEFVNATFKESNTKNLIIESGSTIYSENALSIVFEQVSIT